MMDDVALPDDEVLDDGSKSRRETSTSVDLNADTSLQVDISDALSERDKVKFTVHTKTTLQCFRKNEFSVTRLHEDFIWLHDRYVENDEYAGIVIPPPPPRPDFDASREKLHKLGEGEGSMTKEEFQKMKQELEAEYLATFKKTVAMHEVFLQRCAAHATLRNDVNFRVFLEYEDDLAARGKNSKEKIGGLIKGLAKKADEALVLVNQKEVDEFFEKEKIFLLEYHAKTKDATARADRMTKLHKETADSYIKLSGGLMTLATLENTELDKLFNKVADCFEKVRKLEGRVSTDEDLKLSDTLRYYANDSRAALDLLYRRSRALANSENAAKALEKARAKGSKDVKAAEEHSNEASTKFETMSDVAKPELKDLKGRRLHHFRKNLVDLAELELKHARAQSQLLKACLSSIREDLQ